MDHLLTNWQQQLTIIGEVAVAMLLGGLVGFEREMANKPAGFRTHMLVAGAAALFVGLAGVLVDHYRGQIPGSSLRADPLRLVEAIITGVSFLGAGTIFRRAESKVEGLTTAATILLAAAVGITVALDQYLTAVGITVITLIVLRCMRIIERLAGRNDRGPPGERGGD